MVGNTQQLTCMVQGRIVWVVGNLFAGDLAKVYGSQTPKLNKQGQQYREYGFGLAVPKSVFTPENMTEGGSASIWAKMHEAAYSIFPNRQIPANFHMKWKDGDTGTNQDGSPLNVKEGYPGHLVFSMKTTIPIKFYKYDEAAAQLFLVNEGIKGGDWVNVQLSVNAHAGTNAGLYLNPMHVQFVGFGKEIVNAPTGQQIFGKGAPPVPPGASATPFAQPGFISPIGGQMTAPAPGFTPQQAAPAHYGVLPPAHQPVPQQPPQQAPQQAAQTGMPPIPGYNPQH